jgi:hypothetical protein
MVAAKLSSTERALLRARLRRVANAQKLANKAKRTPAQVAASQANMEKAQKALRYKRSKMWW